MPTMRPSPSYRGAAASRPAKDCDDVPDGMPAIHSERPWKPMPRKLRFSLPHRLALVMQRGHNQEPVFFEAQDYLEYLKIVKRVADTCHCAVHASVLMINSIHL